MSIKKLEGDRFQLVLDSISFLPRLIELLHHNEERVVKPVLSTIITISQNGTAAQIELLFTDRAVKGLIHVFAAGFNWARCKELAACAIRDITTSNYLLNLDQPSILFVFLNPSVLFFKFLEQPGNRTK
jgi:hypothetical protein